LLLIFLILPIFAQRQLSPALQAFVTKDYPTYLAAAPGELAGIEARPQVAFEAMLPAAIALEKTAGWEGESGKQLTPLFAASPDTARWWEACKLLVQGDANGLPRLFGGLAPSPYALTAGARLAREHGYALAADCLTAVSPDMPGLRVKAWLSIPREQRAAVDAVMEKQVAPINLRMLAEAALNFYIEPPNDLGPISPEELLAFAKKYANGLDVVSFQTAERLVQVQKIDAGLAMAGEVAALAPGDLETQRYTARLYWGNQRFNDTARLFWQATENVPAPNSRGARLCYLDFLNWMGRAKKSVEKTPDLPALLNSPDLLIAADARYAAGKLPEATAEYRAAVVNDDLPLDCRLEAWSGLLETDAAAALPIGSRLLDEIIRGDATRRSALARWFAWEAARTLQRDDLLPIGYVRIYSHNFTVAPHAELAEWAPALAVWYEKIVEVDPAALLRYDSQRGGTLRLPIAAANMLAGRPEQAANIMLHKEQYQLTPPPDGWKYFDGSPMSKPFEPHDEVTPREGEFARQWEPLFTVFRQSFLVADQVAPFAAFLARGTAAELQEPDRNENQVNTRVQLLQLCLKMHAAGQDPPASSDNAPRPERKPDLDAFAVLEQAMEDALALDAVAEQSPLLWQTGFLPALLTVRDPKLVDGYFNLLTLSFDRYLAVTEKTDAITSTTAILAKAMEDYQYPPRPDLKPYAQRLREKYPKK